MSDRSERSRLSLVVAAVMAAGMLGSVYGQDADPNGPAVNVQVVITGPGEQFAFNLEEDEQPRCLAHEMSSAGQGAHLSGSGAHLSGSVGGLVLGTVIMGSVDDIVFTEHAEPAVDALNRPSRQDQPQTFQDLLNHGEASLHTVVLLVADDFRGGDFTLPDELWQLNANDSDDVDELRAMVKSGKLSHGAVVLAHLLRLIEGAGRFSPSLSSNDPYRFDVDGGRSELIVVPVDLAINNPNGPHAPIPTSHIAAELSGSIRQWSDTHRTDTGRLGMVVNMSWVLLPCPTVADFLAVDGPEWTFEDYFNSLDITIDGWRTDPVADRDLRLGLLGRVSPTDDLRSLMSELDGPSGLGTKLANIDVDIALVAAAGNFAMDYQLLPAALLDVIGVGTPVADRPLPLFSNAADVAAPGAWFHLDDVVSYAGTSYSAPMVSLFAAIDLASQQSCMPSQVYGGRPGLDLHKTDPQYVQARVLLGDAAIGCGYP